MKSPQVTALVLVLAAAGCATPRPFAGARSEWSGFERLDFEVEERAATIVVPKRAAPGRPWLWRGEFFGAFAEVDRALLAEGWHVAYLQCKNTFGSPDTLRRWEGFYRRLTREHRLARRPVLLGMSRGGLYVYRWAAEHPDTRSEEHTSELQSQFHLVCRLLLEKKKKQKKQRQ